MAGCDHHGQAFVLPFLHLFYRSYRYHKQTHQRNKCDVGYHCHGGLCDAHEQHNLREDENESDNQTTEDGGDDGAAVSTLRGLNSHTSGVYLFHNEVQCDVL